jgi:DNA mismatch repair protein MutS2
MRLFDKNTLSVFEFEKVRKYVEENCRNVSSKRLANGLGPIDDRDDCKLQLAQLNEFTSLLRNKAALPDTLFLDFEAECNALAVEGSVLTEKQLINIKVVSSTVNDVIKFFSSKADLFPALQELIGNVYKTEDIIKAIDVIVDETAYVRSSASKELSSIRADLSKKTRESDRKFRQFVNELNKLGWIRENEAGFYNGRRVLAVLSEFKRDVKGLIHGSSETGKTTFVEPQDTVALNNEIADLQNSERREVYKLLRKLTNELRPYEVLIKNYHILLTTLDFIRAKAYFAVELNAHLPVIEKDPCIDLHNAVHPLLYLQNKASAKKTIPMSISMDRKQRIVIISGPNAGGKSITLKTVGLLQIMLQSGLLIPCSEKSKLSFFNNLLVDIGDSQSIENALSTYSSRLLSMKQFLNVANGRTLFLIDEFGTGTDPELGGAIAEVILEELAKKQAIGIITTHYTNIKLLADNLKGVINASMLFNPETLEPKYELVIGQPGSSYTFEVAEKIGLPKEIIKRAQDKVKSEKLSLNRLLADVQREKNKVTEQLQKLEEQTEATQKAEAKFEALQGKLNDKLEKSKEKQEEINKLVELGKKMNALAEEWQKNSDKKAIIKKFVDSLTAEKHKKQYQLALEKKENTKEKIIARVKKKIQVGGKVRLLKSHQTGIVQEIIKDKARVTFGNINSTVSLENLEPID